MRLFISLRPKPLFLSLLALLGLTAAGLLSLASAQSGAGHEWLQSQAIAFAMGWGGGLLLFFALHPWKWKAIPFFLYLSGIAGLIAVILVGTSVAGHKSWLRLGPLSFQPSEWAKVALITLVAFRLARAERLHLHWFKFFLELLLSLGAMVALVFVQGDLGTSLLLLFTGIGALFLYPIPKKVLVFLLVIGIATAIGGYSFLLSPYQKARIDAVIHPEKNPRGSGYQVTQSKITVGSGQFWGKGYKQGRHHRLQYLPARHSDFIFCVWAEEWGFAGSAALLALYALLLGSLFKLGRDAVTEEGYALAMLGAWHLVVHIGVNLGGVLGLVPLTGVPLPFMSYGGSALVSNFILVALALAATSAPQRLKDIPVRTFVLNDLDKDRGPL